MEAHADIAALGLVPDVKSFSDAEADTMAKAGWVSTAFRLRAIRRTARKRIDLIREMSTEPQE